MNAAPTPAEQDALKRLRASLYEWHFCDLKKAATAEVDLPRLAFVGLASWIDTVARLYTGRQLDGFSAWRAFIREYLPGRMHAEQEVRRLYDGLRNALSHEYGTRNVLLTNGKPFMHWADTGNGLRFLDLDALLDEFEDAFEKFYADLQTKADLRARVLPQAKGLLAPVEVSFPPRRLSTVDPAITASATSSVASLVRDFGSSR